MKRKAIPANPLLDRRILKTYKEILHLPNEAITAQLKPLLQFAISQVERDPEVPEFFYLLNYLDDRWDESRPSGDAKIWHNLYLTFTNQLIEIPQTNQ